MRACINWYCVHLDFLEEMKIERKCRSWISKVLKVVVYNMLYVVAYCQSQILVYVKTWNIFSATITVRCFAI